MTIALEQGHVLVGNTKIPLCSDIDLVLTRISVLVGDVWEINFLTPEDPLIDEIGDYLLSH